MVITYQNGVAIVKCLYDTHALRAPPPFAWPSNFVMITKATSTLSLKARACQYTDRYRIDSFCHPYIKIYSTPSYENTKQTHFLLNHTTVLSVKRY